MKKKIFKSLLAIICLLCSTSVSAYDFEVDGIYYDVVVLSDLTCKVVSGDQKYEGDIVIPSTVVYSNRTFSVVEIGNSAFGNTDITSVTIPNSVTSIEVRAFYRCNNLTHVTIPNSVTTTGRNVFEDCKNLTSVKLSDSLTKIEYLLFSGCSNLTDVTIPNSVTEIGRQAFEKCTSLTSIAIPNSVTYLSDHIFYNCTSLKSVIIGNSVSKINYNDFDGCSSLTSVTFGDAVVEIDDDAFANCSSLVDITIPNSVTTINNYVFRNCTSLKTVTFGNSVTKIGTGVFANCNALTSIYSQNPIPPTIKYESFTTAHYMSCHVYVPKDALKAYQNDEGWSEFWNLQGIDPAETVIELPTEYKYSTYSTNVALDFTDNADIKAYTATVNGTTVELTEINKVPANTGLILENVSGSASTVVVVTVGVDAVKDNALVAVKEAMDAKALVEAGAYILVDDETFQKVGEEATGTLAAGKAYLKVDNATGARILTIGGTPTSIEGVTEKAVNADDTIYNLQGVRVKTPTTPGLYIINGKVYKF